jgi:hypothetical protein
MIEHNFIATDVLKDLNNKIDAAFGHDTFKPLFSVL